MNSFKVILTGIYVNGSNRKRAIQNTYIKTDIKFITDTFNNLIIKGLSKEFVDSINKYFIEYARLNISDHLYYRELLEKYNTQVKEVKKINTNPIYKSIFKQIDTKNIEVCIFDILSRVENEIYHEIALHFLSYFIMKMNNEIFIPHCDLITKFINSLSDDIKNEIIRVF